ncbi:Glyoxalase/Bleomycin resistance protein/Dioxygenase superfamily protein [Calidithermus terrae]|uniref:Glyoxalase/Bleomycin resistance protein/Dioxygenase superfamily protein n=1 Tax=Calidithermus terrae TaxID=1408545 RepID=A0A399DTR6_9DEIN|nr:VOC family protein [Calidithermus terrae]RIH74833.1 Glyoxalase/Bleomycin resistance protein/Dioxygenase superfamily protein [Calidithermus terrae]
MIAPILAVNDVDASVAFYTRKLGFKHDFSFDGPDGKSAFAFVSLGQCSIGLSRAQGLEARGQGVVLMAYVPQDFDLEAYYADVQAKGVAVVEPLQEQYWGDRSFTVHDPDGYVICPTKTVKQVVMEEIAAAMRGEREQQVL